MAQQRVSRDEWARRVREWEASGLSMSEYARRHRLTARRLTWWRWKLARGGGGGAFVEVRIDDEVGTPIEVVLANGRIVRVPASFDDDALARVLSVAEAA